MQKTIYAPLTPIARSAVAIVRISGNNAKIIVGYLSKNPIKSPRVAILSKIYSLKKIFIDEVMVLWFPAPNSFTGEDVIEIHSHGGVMVIKSILNLMKDVGFQYAKPGEFTKRAVLNNKMSLDKSEAIADLINAETPIQMQGAIASMHTINTLKSWRNYLLEMLAIVEINIDFGDDMAIESTKKQLQKLLFSLRSSVNNVSQNTAEELAKSNIKIVIMGVANAGKSTLINHITGSDISITSEIAGTTRDVIESNLDIAGHKVTLIDTAGIRANVRNPIEIEGIKRAYAKIKNSTIRVAVIDCNNIDAEYSCIQHLINKNTILVASKADSVQGKFLTTSNGTFLAISAHKNKGIDDLLSIIQQKISTCFDLKNDSILLRERYKNAVYDFIKYINEIYITDNMEVEIIAHQLHSAIAKLNESLGEEFNNEDILNKIFSNFCIGK
ncbi:tRNA modification GTPase MnmE [Candidatus Xenohaliotis californiensis]|uniref:tRNA modification GTPase MnmE n=1 Tax=Candidatus Xenohaliotis californiensis TaxID=84677 RepID=A0ABM9N8W5_9RICK|nr:tRNA modification GTPase MnmE [Candidatus Xenohaliotis californiensis]